MSLGKKYDLIIIDFEISIEKIIGKHNAIPIISIYKQNHNIHPNNLHIQLKQISLLRALEIFLKEKTAREFKLCLRRKYKSSMMKLVDHKLERIKDSHCPLVLVTGEAGAGKELVVRNICTKAENLIEVNCAAIPKELLESELFGYEKGAFTGADHAKPGLFELAQNGVLFLDEIGELPIPLQAKLLELLNIKNLIDWVLLSLSSLRTNCLRYQ